MLGAGRRSDAVTAQLFDLRWLASPP
jgi:hypothetical protein